ncbi:craniofacial development protein 2-like [Aphis craccivora]|uniref:Craniofacial development protein 2-like n=1 Tax=Aphis craccivora TaxID=307492 RepID=A0A6G0YDW4_APHCR|nr:craniofacial development protein 2-like [Aphis craccivora]
MRNIMHNNLRTQGNALGAPSSTVEILRQEIPVGLNQITPVPQSDLQVGTTQEVNPLRMKMKGHDIKRIGTWNVKTLLQTGKLENLKVEMKRLKIDILGVSQMRWPKSGDFWSGEYRIIYSGTEDGRLGKKKRIGIVLQKNMGHKVKGYVQYSDRIILVKLDTKPIDTVIIQVYMHTSEEEDDEVERIYEELNDLMEKGEENLIILGDFNAIVGEGKEKNIVGKYGLGIRNPRGEILLEFCIRNNLIITNTHFQHHKRRRYTWQSPGDIRRAQIDYILVRGRYKNQVKDSKSCPGADINSDHNLVLMHCELKFKRLQKKKGMKRFQLTILKTDRVITETYDAQCTLSIEEKGGNIKQCGKEWINEEILEMINERRKYKNATDQRGKEKYRKLKNAINRECKKSKENINEALKVGLMDKTYGIVRTFFKERKFKMASIKEANGNIIYEEVEVAKCWKKYLEQLYQIDEEQQNDTEEIDQSLMREEFDKALMELKNKKAPGVDEIPAELIQN